MPDRVSSSLTLLCFGYLPWSSQWKRNQSIAYYLQQHDAFGECLFINPPVYMTATVTNLAKEFRGELKKASWSALRWRKKDKKVWALSPLLVNRHRVFDAVNAKLLQRLTVDLKRRLKNKRFWVLVNDFHLSKLPMYRELLPLAEKVIVDISDDQQTSESKCLDYSLSQADKVLCVSDSVRKAYDDNSGKYILFRNGLHPECLSLAKSSIKDPLLARGCKHPVVGYMGVIGAHRMDSSYLHAIFSSFPEVDFVFLGQDSSRFLRPFLEKYSNVRHFPPVDYKTMLRYVSFFDAAIIPHLNNPHTEGNDLLKVYIYGGLGVPVIATHVSGLNNLSDFVFLAEDTGEFCRGVQAALSQSEDNRREKGRELARANLWPKKMESLYAALELGKKEYAAC